MLVICHSSEPAFWHAARIGPLMNVGAVTTDACVRPVAFTSYGIFSSISVAPCWYPVNVIGQRCVS